jgi:hypothetical protein
MVIKYQFKMEYQLKIWNSSSMKGLNLKTKKLNTLSQIQVDKDNLDLKQPLLRNKSRGSQVTQKI